MTTILFDGPFPVRVLMRRRASGRARELPRDDRGEGEAEHHELDRAEGLAEDDGAQNCGDQRGARAENRDLGDRQGGDALEPHKKVSRPPTQDGDHERLSSHQGGGDASRQAFGRDEQQREEEADVQQAERRGFPSPRFVPQFAPRPSILPSTPRASVVTGGSSLLKPAVVDVTRGCQPFIRSW